MRLTAEIIDNLEKCDEKIINRYQRQISKEIATEAKLLGIQKARENANKKYGKFWRERLELKCIYNGSPSGKMSYY